ncbi:MAG TPA: NAD-dependent epimerase/dehydratase family protein [Bacteroidales bacterium]|nr:NAD-dependent epimerase/dehydratase family protein [Bacteroidales bacterium]HPM93299.1 NAD-dependent epimerase/dehydratase family protein [Bacteroidales bacterium]
MKYFITGATGFIGGKLARRLVKEGHTINALVRDPAKATDLKELGINVFKGDITDKSSLSEPMAGVDGVYHVAAWYKVGVKDKSMAYSINVNGTRNVLEVMKEGGIKKGVYTSTLAVNSDTRGKIVNENYRYDGKHLSEYDRTKWLAHHEVALPMMKEGLPLVVVMPGLVYGPGDTSAAGETFKRYLQGKLPVLPTQTAYNWAHVDDIVEGHILAMEKGRAGEAYMIGGPVHELTEAMMMAEEITGVKAPRLHLSPAMMKASAGLMGFLEKFLPIPDLFSGEMLRATAGVTYIGDSSKARRELGYDPRPLKEGLSETLGLLKLELGIK